MSSTVGRFQLRPPRHQLSRKLHHVPESQAATSLADRTTGKVNSSRSPLRAVVGRPDFDGLAGTMESRRQFPAIGGDTATKRGELVGDDHDSRFCACGWCHAWATVISTDWRGPANPKKHFHFGSGFGISPTASPIVNVFLMSVTLTENDVADLKEGLRRCSPETIDAAIRYRETG